MGSGIFVSNEVVDLGFVLLTYLPVGLISARWLIPRLTAMPRHLASIMLAAVMLTTALSWAIWPTSFFVEWLWDIDAENNIPSLMASTQLAMVAGVALITAWLGRTRPAWNRIHLLGVGLALLLLALDEFFDFPRLLGAVRHLYFIVGPALVAATAVVAVRAPRRVLIWHTCLVVGLALMALGGLVIDDLPESCGTFGFLRLSGCLDTQFLEECLELMGGWLALVSSLGLFCDAVPSVNRRVQLLPFMIPAFWIPFLLLFSPANLIEVSPPDQPVSARFDSGVHLYGYRIESDGLPSSIIVRLPFGANAYEQVSRFICLTR